MSAQAEYGPVYVYDGELEGYYTAVFTAFERKETPLRIDTERAAQPSLFCETVRIETDGDKAMRVKAGLEAKLGRDEERRVRMAFLSDEPGHELDLLRYIQIAMRKGRYAYCDHADPVVARYEKLWRYVSNERHRMLQFARFSEMEGGVYFAKVNPRANVVPLMMDHFSKRFNTQAFMIFDAGHEVAGVSKDGRWQLVRTGSVNPPPDSAREKEYRRMWRAFYDAVCNEERRNDRLRKSFMPQRLWANICEVADEVPAQARRGAVYPA